jgi:hypothetical protein
MCDPTTSPPNPTALALVGRVKSSVSRAAAYSEVLQLRQITKEAQEYLLVNKEI